MAFPKYKAMESLNPPRALILLMNGKPPLDEFERALRMKIERIVRDIMGDIPSMIESALESFKPVKRVAEGNFLVPESDIYIRDGNILAVIQIPGAQRDSIDIRVRDKVLEVEAGFSEDLAKRASDASIFRFRGYRCSLSLPKEVDPNLAKATYREGILLIELPIQKPKGVQVKIE
ncbi:MAG: hypothetical protein DRN65_04100 [Thaumarchaeota archaeon]|nr:MAG: hypothetical protein DRN65_04100 [Nitrososphaerota archaeon]